MTVLHVGVKHGDTPERLNSHAWLSADGLVVAGGEIDLDFQELGQFGALVRSGSMQSRIHLAGRRKVS